MRRSWSWSPVARAATRALGLTLTLSVACAGSSAADPADQPAATAATEVALRVGVRSPAAWGERVEVLVVNEGQADYTHHVPARSGCGARDFSVHLVNGDGAVIHLTNPGQDMCDAYFDAHDVVVAAGEQASAAVINTGEPVYREPTSGAQGLVPAELEPGVYQVIVATAVGELEGTLTLTPP